MSVAEQAYVFAKERILDGRYTAGELISEGDVAAGVGVSRTPVREAFLRLETEGLLRLYPKRGALVVPVSAAEVESVMETRLLVEQFAVAKVMSAGIDLESRPHQAIARQEELATRHDERNFVEIDREFHRIYVAAAGNPILLQLHDSLRDRQSRMMLAALARDADRLQQVLDEHRALADAVVAGDAELARDVLAEHLNGTLKLLRLASAPTPPPV